MSVFHVTLILTVQIYKNNMSLGNSFGGKNKINQKLFGLLPAYLYLCTRFSA